MIRYYDASALVKRYVTERGSATVRRLLKAGGVATSRLSEVEVTSALARRQREGGYGERRRAAAEAALLRDLAEFQVVELSPGVCRDARLLVRCRALRAADAIQLASALLVARALSEPIAVVAFDDRLRAAAVTEGLAVLPARIGAGRA